MQRDTELILLSYIPEDLSDINIRIENWSRWSRDRWRRGHCRSIEHRYMPPRADDDKRPREEFDGLDGEALHSHVCDLPEKQRWMLHLWFVHRAPPGYVRRQLAIRRDQLPYELHKAMRMLRNRALAFGRRMG